MAADDPRQADVVRRFLARDGHEVRDVMRPGPDGASVCRLLRRGSSPPVLMPTARVEEEDLLAGPAAGVLEVDRDRRAGRPAGTVVECTRGGSGNPAARATGTQVIHLRRTIQVDPRGPQRLVSVYAVGHELVAIGVAPP